MHLYWLVKKQEDLYLNNLCRSWNDALEDFQYHPIIGDNIKLLANIGQFNLQDCDVYLSGEEENINETKKWLLENKLPQEQLFIHITDEQLN
jgi:CDP-4-dehydro-6-deoxyglucose reductase